MSPRKPAPKVLLTHRALEDLSGIEAFSVAQWGKRTAAKYISDIDAALTRLQENPELPSAEPEFHSSFRFYRVNKHLLVCDIQAGAIVLLTIIHASRDVASRLAELQPTLAADVELLHKRLAGK